VSEPHSKTHASLEFGGTFGNLALIVGLPALTAAFWFAVRFNGGALIPGPDADYEGFFASMWPTWTAVGLYAGWLTLQAALQAWAPGPVIEGTELPQGGRLKYRMNGPAALLITLLLAVAGTWTGWLDPSVIPAQFGALITVMTCFTFVFSGFLYWWGKQHGQARDLSGNPVHDFWMGTGHNPRLPPGGLFDLKFFCEARPGLILWVLIDLALAATQHQQTGSVSTAMALVCFGQCLYVLDYYLHEPAILTTMDIKHENFGYMLAFGDLVWVPMTYTLQAMYCLYYPPDVPAWAAVTLVLGNLVGLAIFRSVNNQKDRFRRSSDGAVIWGKPAEFLQTAQGNKLLLSGFWGWSRHFNYVGDLIMAWSWSLPCGFASPLPYFYPIYFTILLVHRERRDHEFCARKYGPDWQAYCERVPWRILPYVY
jgi:delta14-sterol reductase